MNKVLYIIIFLSFNCVQAQFRFPDLDYIEIMSSNLNGGFGYSKSLSFEIINKNCSELKNCYEYEDPTILIGKLVIEDNSIIEFHYTEAPSDDPTFIAVKNGKVVLEASGNILHLKGKILYIEGIGNSYFNKKRKFSFIDNLFKEVNQPFYDISVKGTLNFPIDIYESESFSNRVASLPKGYQIEIVLGKTGGEYDDLETILIKSEFGLIGWFNFKDISFGEQLIDGFYFHGD
ncbi:MAG: hypothetical protein ACI9DK_002469 [Vicingaceae bacterium]|jgi:hypothetical protein